MKPITLIAALILMTTQAGAVSLMPSAKDERKPELGRTVEHDSCDRAFGKYTVKSLRCNWEAAGVAVERRKAWAARQQANRYPEGNPKRKLWEAESQIHEARGAYRRERMNRLLESR